jgi:hypothetical protein
MIVLDGGWGYLGLAANAVMVAVEVVRIGVGHVPEDSEVSVRDVRAVEIRRRRRDAESCDA